MIGYIAEGLPVSPFFYQGPAGEKGRGVEARKERERMKQEMNSGREEGCGWGVAEPWAGPALIRSGNAATSTCFIICKFPHRIFTLTPA